MRQIPVFKTIKKENNNLPKVYFSCIDKDFFKYFKMISDEILAVQDCNIYYLENRNFYPSNNEDKENYLSNLKNINLFIFPITFNFLMKNSLSKNIDYLFAKENNYPILPILVEPGLSKLINQQFGDIHILDANSIGTGENSFRFKLQKYLDSLFVSKEKVEKIREAFDAYIFLSYRKKDKKHAQEIMSLIHKIDFMRDVAIWYDENLTFGRDFNDEIKAIMQKSDIVSFVVTPNINEKDNYVLTVEYPAAIDNNKKILPIESEETDKELLKYNFKKFPNVINKDNADELANKLKELILKEGFKENDDPEHLYFIGLAYLNAIDVERDIEKAIKLLKKSANYQYVPSIKELINIYQNGKGVLINYKECIKWQSMLLKMSKDEQILFSTMNLAYYYSEDGNYQKSIELNTICYEKYIKEFGASWHTSISLLNNLSRDYCNIGNFSLALKIDTECYDLKVKKIGEDHPDTLLSLRNLAYDYNKIGKIKKALELNEKCYRKLSKILGPSHSDTISSLNNLAANYIDLGNYSKALVLQSKCYEIQNKKLGPNHPDTLLSLSNIASCYIETGDYKKALELNKKCYEQRSEILGSNHPDTLISLNNLADNYLFLKDYSKALDLHLNHFQICEYVYGAKHFETALSMDNLATNYLLIHDYYNALELQMKCYNLLLSIVGSEHPDTLVSMSNLAKTYSIIGDSQKAIELYRLNYEKSLKILGKNHSNTISAYQNLLKLYMSTGDLKKLKKLINGNS